MVKTVTVRIFVLAKGVLIFKCREYRFGRSLSSVRRRGRRQSKLKRTSKIHWGALLLHLLLFSNGKLVWNWQGEPQFRLTCGRPKSCTTLEIIVKVHQIVLEDWRFKVYEITEYAGVSNKGILHILTKVFDKKKKCAWCVPRFLTSGHKRTRVNFSTNNFLHFYRIEQ